MLASVLMYCWGYHDVAVVVAVVGAVLVTLLLRLLATQTPVLVSFL